MATLLLAIVVVWAFIHWSYGWWGRDCFPKRPTVLWSCQKGHVIGSSLLHRDLLTPSIFIRVRRQQDRAMTLPVPVAAIWAHFEKTGGDG